MSASRISRMLAIGAVAAAGAVVVRALRGGPAPAFLPEPPRAPGLLLPATPRATAPGTEPAEAGGGVAPSEPEAPSGATGASAHSPAVSEPTGAAEVALAPGEDAGTGGADHSTAPTWVPPVDGGCPPGYPVKAKLRSGIYHRPGMAAYERTRPDRCYPTPEAAEADGLRPARH